jgi:hypothetical protein
MFSKLTRSLAFTLLVCSWAISQTQPSSDSSKKEPEKSAPITVTPISTTLPPPDKSAPQSQPLQPKLTPAQVTEIEKRPKISKETRLKIIQAMNAEYARTRKTLPVGYKEITLTAEGKIKPEDSRLYQMSLTNGSTAKVGDRIQITSISVRDKSIYFEINGGPKKKTHWYQHVQIGAGGGMVSPGGNPTQDAPPGSAVTLEFKNYVPEITGPEVKALLDPIFDFSVKTATDVYLESVPPKVRDAIKKHEVLVGMNHDMVVMAKDRPGQKLREKDEKGVEYEEWIYGQPPHDVTFVRFVGDEVTQVKIMKIDGEEVLKTEKEVDVKDGVVTLAAATASTGAGADKPQQPAHAPSLKRPGETEDTTVTGPPTGHIPQTRPDATDPASMPPLPPPNQPAGGQQPPI